jgi:hypothetical protein
VVWEDGGSNPASYPIVCQGRLLAYSVEKLVCEMSDFATLILMRGLCSG